MKRWAVFAILVSFILLGLTSCKKETQIDQQTIEATIAADNSIAEGILIANSETSEEKDAVVKDTSCYTVERYIDWTNLKGYLTITFNGDCADGISRSGTMKIVWDLGWRFKPDGKGLIIEYDNFVRNDKVFNGKITIASSVETVDSNVIVVLNVTLDSFYVQFSDGTDLLLSGTKTIKYLNGFFTFFNRYDDELLINSQMQGRTRDGVEFTSVATDLLILRSCNYILPVSGTKTITLADGTTYIIDFGNGECDNVYTVTVNGETTTYTFGD